MYFKLKYFIIVYSLVAADGKHDAFSLNWTVCDVVCPGEEGKTATTQPTTMTTNENITESRKKTGTITTNCIYLFDVF